MSRFCPVHGIRHSSQEVHVFRHFVNIDGEWKAIPRERKRYFLAREGRTTLYQSRWAAWEAYCPWALEQDLDLGDLG